MPPPDIFRPWWDRQWLRQLAWAVIALSLVVLIGMWWRPAPHDVVSLANVPSGVRKILLLDSEADPSTQPDCPEDKVISFDGTETEIDNVPAGCPVAVVLFVAGFAPALDPTPVWTDGDDKIVETLAPLHTVTLRSSGEYPEAVDELTAGVEAAKAIATAYPVGIDIVASGEVTLIEPAASAFAAAISNAQRTDPATCGKEIADDPALYLAASSDVYVFFVREDQWRFANDDYGWTCGDRLNILFLRQGAKAATLAHELGHAFGLTHAESDQNPAWPGGHQANLMYCCGFSPDSAAEVSRLTLSQAYRVNFEVGSWLNKAGIRAAAKKSCNGNLDPSGPCPYIQLDWP